MPEPLSEARAMIAALSPRLDPAIYAFCTTDDPALAARAAAGALATFAEDEGLSLILPLGVATELGFDTALPMRRIILTVHSALDGVGLTAAVAQVLATAGIPCNMVAGYHHDHVFIPEALAEPALACLHRLQRAAG